MRVADRVEYRIRAMGLSDTESAKVLRRFEEARRERRAWDLSAAIAILLAAWVGWRLARSIRRSRTPA